ncbi:MAG: UDP-N-acetylglucosamine 2-epimerase (non-hydrolyzing) [Spirochaetales bacterium]|nr:UDP-N-acetylglucosamine 2-epimerase (non-hydrolyzing) [Spirochaetales bacterium]
MIKFYSVVGTRPNFVKEFLINSECRKRGIREILVHTGQHYDYEMSQIFFDCFHLPKPDHHLAVQNLTAAQFSADVIIRLDSLLKDERPDFVLSYGDVNSTLSAAVAATKNHIPFFHVEGGVRGDNLYNPEEINRRVADVLSEVIYCCTRNDIKNLQKENYDNGRIVYTGDLMNDALMFTLKEHNIVPQRGDYMVLTLHRQENVMHPERLGAIIDGLIQSQKRIIFPAHPRTLNQIRKNGLMEGLARSKIEVVKPMGYLEFVKLLAGSDKVLTDSGGVRREAYLLKKPCIVLIELSWFPEISEAGWKVLTKPDSSNIEHLVQTFEPRGEHRNIFGDGKAYINIIDDIEKRCG